MLKFILKNTDLLYEDDCFECLPIHLAIEKKHFESVKILLPYTDDLTYESEYHKRSHENPVPLDLAIEMNDIRIVKVMLTRLNKIENSSVKRAISYAENSGGEFSKNSAKIMKLLLPYTNEDFQPNAYCEETDTTPLECMAENGCLDAIKVLTTYDAKTKRFCKNPFIPYSDETENGEILGFSLNACSPIYKAIEYGHFEVAKYLIGCKPLQEDDKPSDSHPYAWNRNRTPIHAAAEIGNTEILKILMETAVNPNNADDDGITPIHLAAKNGHVEVVKILIATTKNPNSHDKEGKTPLQLATTNGHINVIKTLIKSILGLESLDKEATKNDHNDIVELFTSMKITLEIHQPDYKCSCGKSFTSAQSLKSHVKAVHEGIKSHKCDHCERSFAEALDLKRHIKVHEGIEESKNKKRKIE